MREARAMAHRPSTGFTLIELIIVICLVAVFMAVALDRLRRYQESAENSMVELTVASMQSGLQMRVAALLIAGDERAIRALNNANPVRFLADFPVGYRGELEGPAESLRPASWYFDVTRHELVYIPELKSNLVVQLPRDDGEVKLRFRTSVEFGPATDWAPGRAPVKSELKNARIVKTVVYSWFR